MNIKEVFITLHRLQSDGIIGPCAVGGAVATTFYLEPVSTLDVDIFVTLTPPEGAILLSLDPLYEALKASGFETEGEYVMIAGWPVRFLPLTGPLAEEALAEAAEMHVENTPVRVFTAEHLAAIALQTGRAKDKSRLLQFVESGCLDTTRFQSILERHQLGETWQRLTRQFLDDSE